MTAPDLAGQRDHAVATLRAVVAALRGDGPATAAMHSCPDCRYMGPFDATTYGCVSCMGCAPGEHERTDGRCVQAEPICPVCDGGFIAAEDAGPWAVGLMLAEAALRDLDAGPAHTSK